MIHIGTVTNNERKKNRDSDENQRILSCEITSPDDVQSVELSNVSGEDNNPLNEDTVLIIPITDAYKLGILIDDGVAPDGSILKGEKLLYSRDSSGAVKAKIAFKNNGDLIFNDGAGFAVEFDQLKIAFNQLKTDLDTALTALTLPLSTANIDPAKVAKVKL